MSPNTAQSLHSRRRVAAVVAAVVLTLIGATIGGAKPAFANEATPAYVEQISAPNPPHLPVIGPSGAIRSLFEDGSVVIQRPNGRIVSRCIRWAPCAFGVSGHRPPNYFRTTQSDRNAYWHVWANPNTTLSRSAYIQDQLTAIAQCRQTGECRPYMHP